MLVKKFIWRQILKTVSEYIHLTCIVSYVTHIKFYGTNLYMFDSIWIVSTHFCMLPPPTQHLVKKAVFITVNEHTYRRRNTSMYCVTD